MNQFSWDNTLVGVRPSRPLTGGALSRPSSKDKRRKRSPMEASAVEGRPISDAGLFREAADDFEGEGESSPDSVDVPAGTVPAERSRPEPHRRKLEELLNNDKLPPEDAERVRSAAERYRAWIEAMARAPGKGDDKVAALVAACNSYKRFIELELIWDSPGEFLFRQRGQTKLDNSIIEEFLPWLIDPMIVPALASIDCMAGPRKAFAAASFTSTLTSPGIGGALLIRTKDQDFSVSRRAYLQSSFSIDFPAADTTTHEIHLAYVAAECKTNLDKTMFQEASATAHDLKIALPGAHYYLVTEFLDMTPINTAGTDIDEVLILRGRRMGAQLRSSNSKPAYRAAHRDEYEAFLGRNPIRTDVVVRLVDHLRAVLENVDPATEDVLNRGYF